MREGLGDDPAKTSQVASHLQAPGALAHSTNDLDHIDELPWGLEVHVFTSQSGNRNRMARAGTGSHPASSPEGSSRGLNED